LHGKGRGSCNDDHGESAFEEVHGFVSILPATEGR
jgi:hypothetical protein